MRRLMACRVVHRVPPRNPPPGGLHSPHRRVWKLLRKGVGRVLLRVIRLLARAPLRASRRHALRDRRGDHAMKRVSADVGMARGRLQLADRLREQRELRDRSGNPVEHPCALGHARRSPPPSGPCRLHSPTRRAAPRVTELRAGNIGGHTLTAGVYKWGTGAGTRPTRGPRRRDPEGCHRS